MANRKITNIDISFRENLFKRADALGIPRGYISRAVGVSPGYMGRKNCAFSLSNAFKCAEIVGATIDELIGADARAEYRANLEKRAEIKRQIARLESELETLERGEYRGVKK